MNLFFWNIWQKKFLKPVYIRKEKQNLNFIIEII